MVGPLFTGPSDTGLHFCTASVVHSPAHDLLITAAHCLSGTGAGLSFVPMFHDGAAPFGMWKVVAAYASRRWLSGRDPREDVAFLVVAPRVRKGKRIEVEDVVGADRLVVSSAIPSRATLVGYPIGTGGRPITCTNGVYDHLGYPGFDCGGFVGGTSGGPWITHLDRSTALGRRVGRHRGSAPGRVHSEHLVLVPLRRRHLGGLPGGRPWWPRGYPSGGRWGRLLNPDGETPVR